MTLTKINSKGIKDGEIINADINASAAIAGTKISPDFGSQNIRTTGNVGIGTSSPSSLFHVRPLDETNFLVRNEGSTVVLASETNSGRDSNRGMALEATAFEFIESGSEKMRLDSSGHLGIGTGSPDAAIEVVSDATNGVHGYLGGLKNNDNSSAVRRIKFGTTNYRNYIQSEQGSGGDNFTSDNDLILNPSGGKIGVGTDSPDQTLHVHKGSAGSASSDANTVLTLENNNHCILQMLSPAANSNRIMFGDPDAANAGEINYDHNINSLLIKTNGSERLRVNSSGKVGIGGDPLEPLDVLLSGTSRRILFRYHGSINNIQSANANSNNEHLALCGDTLRFHTGSSGTGTEAMRIDSSGRVMIGVTGVNHASANADDFCVGNNDSSSEHGITIGSNVAGTIRWADSGSGGAGIIEYVHGGDQMNFYTSGTLAVAFKSNQRVLMPAVYSAAGSSMRDVQIESDGNLCGLSSITAAKTNITDLTDVSWIYNLKPKSFNFRKKTVDPVTGVNTYLDEAEDEKAHGFLAEDVESINKDFCFYDKDSEGKDVLAGVYYKTMVVPLIKAVQDLKAENTSLAKRVAALEAA